MILSLDLVFPSINMTHLIMGLNVGSFVVYLQFFSAWLQNVFKWYFHHHIRKTLESFYFSYLSFSAPPFFSWHHNHVPTTSIKKSHSSWMSCQSPFFYFIFCSYINLANSINLLSNSTLSQAVCFQSICGSFEGLHFLIMCFLVLERTWIPFSYVTYISVLICCPTFPLVPLS